MNDEVDPGSPIWLRMLRYPLTRLILLGGALITLMAVTDGFHVTFAGRPFLAFAITLGMLGIALTLYIGFGRLVERRMVTELSLPGMGRELGIGLLVGCVLYTLSVLVLMLFGIYRIEGLNPWTFVLPAVVMALSSGVFEELVFRGVVFRSLEDLLGSWAALVGSSLIFGLVHLINPASTLVGAISISIEAGLLLAAAYMLTRRLWLSIGFHIAWNYTQSAIFSGIVSGNAPQPGLIRSNIQGPEILTGGNFGLESSIVAFAICTATGVVILIMAVRKGAIVPPPWRRER